MTKIHSNVLIVGPHEYQFKKVDVDHLLELPVLEDIAKYKVVILNIQASNVLKITSYIEQLKNQSYSPFFILLTNDEKIKNLDVILATGCVFQILDQNLIYQFEHVIVQALNFYNQEQQKKDFLKILNEQNESLKSISNNLEEKIEKREKSIFRSKTRLVQTNTRMEALNKALIAIHKSNSIGMLEESLNEALADTLQLEWVRFFFQSHNQLENRLKNNNDFSLFSANIISADQSLAQIYFARDKNEPFKKDEIDFLNQIAEAVSLALDRLSKLEQSESLKQQWEATFDAISEPLCLCNENFEIIKTNKAFSIASDTSFDQIIGNNCFEVLLKQPMKNIDKKNILKKSFRIYRNVNDSQQTFEVNCQKLEDENQNITLIIFSDITEQLKIEKQLIESSKMAELGTIGSSIAHELNNPLGGMLSFLQLIKMDLNSEQPIFEDIVEMEAAAKRCKDIVENLLGFSRKHDTTNAELIDLKEVLNQSLKITEIKTRSQGITVSIDTPKAPVIYRGEFNLLSQAIRNLLQNAQESISQKMTDIPRFEGLIKVEIIEEQQGHPTIVINDNGQGMNTDILNKVFNPLYSTKNPSTHSGLGLTLAYKIIDEHNGRLEIYSQPNIGTTAKISF